MTDREMIDHMFQLQEELNIKIKGMDWRNHSLPWKRAIWTECAEMLDSIDWKWWSKKDTDWKNVHIELVDIWHFGMSDLLQKFEKSQNINFSSLQSIKPLYDYKNDIIYLIEYIANTALNNQPFHYQSFFLICQYCNFSYKNLYNLYIGKQVLNKFRNDHGYAEGIYHKCWLDGKEDNEFLYEVAKNEDMTESSFYESFEKEYQKVLQKE